MTTPRVGALARSASARADDVRAASRLRSAACSTSRPQQPLPPARRIHPTRASSAARTAGSTRTTCDDAESPPLAPPAEDEAPEVTSRRLAEEALASAVEFESLWVSDSSVRGKINGEEAAARARAASGANTPRRRRGYQPTASDIEREELAASTAASAAHPAAALFDDPDFRLAKVASLYRFLKPAVTPRDVPNGCGDGGGVARALAARPTALHDLTPRDAARLLVHLRREHGEAADLVDVVAAKDFEALLAPPPDRDDSDAAREARARARRLEAMAAAGGAMRTVTARVEARVGIDKGRLETADGAAGASSTGDGRTQGGGKWTVGGTLKGTTTRADDLKVRFWNLWGGSSECRRAVTQSPRGSVFRDPARMEAAVTRLDRYVPFIDVPMLLHRAPPLLEVDTETLVRRVAGLKLALRGGDLGAILGLAPGLLLASAVEANAAVAEVRREVKLAREERLQPPLRQGSAQEQRAVYEATMCIVKAGGAESLLKRAERKMKKQRVVLLTERTSPH